MCVFENTCLIMTMASIWSLVVFTVSAKGEYNLCPDLRPPRNININQIMGLYFAIEIIQHKDEPHHRGTSTVGSCPLVQLSRVQGTHSMVKLLWKEQAGHVEYNFYIPDQDNPGYWMSSGPQNGSMILQMPYRQFAGTVHVMHTTNRYTVLTFCSPRLEHYSVLLSRDMKLKRSERIAVHDLLIKKDLQEIGVREACRDSATAISSSVVLILTVIVVIFTQFYK